MPPSVPTWLVTGASGFLGANIGWSLTSSARRVALSRTGAAPHHFDEALAGDLQNASVLADQVLGLKPDVVLHAAALASHQACEREPDLALLINAKATGILAEAAHQVGARFVYISTDAVFDGRIGHYREDDPPSPNSIYGRTKLAGEALAQDFTDALVIRTNFFGWSPSGSRSILEFFVNELSQGHRIRGFTDFTTSSAYAQDLVQTIHSLLDAGAVGTFHVTSSDSMTKHDFGVAVAEEFSLDSCLIDPAKTDIHPSRAGDISLDVTKVQRLLGVELPTMREGIRRALDDSETLRHRIQVTSRP